MKSIYSAILILVLLFFSSKAFAQVNVMTGQTPQQLAEIVAGPGVVVSNAGISTGSPNSIGSFSSITPTGFGIQSGILLSSGDVNEAPGNPVFNADSDMGTPGDAYLGGIIGLPTNDAMILEFDFVPNSDFVSFKFVFASEEYDEYVCTTQFFDVFALTIEGFTAPLPLTNMALVPGTTLPIGINSINNGSAGFLADGSCSGANESLAFSQYYNLNVGTQVVYDGFTIVMTAESQVVCGETYRLRFMIADGWDRSYDSVVFIEENSLTTGNVTIQTSSLGGDTMAIEGCGNLEVTLTLNGDPAAQDYPVSLWLSGASAAQWGVDYDPINALNPLDSTIVIPAGSNSVSFNIAPINDNISEGIESIDIVAITSTCGSLDTISLYIEDLDPLVVTVSNDTAICQGNAICWAESDGGGGEHTYTWNQGYGIADTIFPPATLSTTYVVSVTDECGSTAVTDSIIVSVDAGPAAIAGNDVSVCIGGSILLNASTDTPNCSYEWDPAIDLSDSTILNPLCTPTVDMEYVVTVTRSDGCSNEDTVNVTLTPPPTAAFDLPLVGCAGDPLIINYTGNASTAAQYLWNFTGGTIANGNGIGPYAVFWSTPGIYDVDLTVAWNGCLSSTEINQVEIIGSPVVNAGADVSFCSGEMATIGSTQLNGVNYTWVPINGVADVNASLTTVELTNSTHNTQTFDYTLMAEDQGCKSYDTVQVVVFPNPTAEFVVPQGLCFNVNRFDLLAAGYFGPNASFNWDFGPVGFPSTSTSMQPQGVIFNAPGAQDVTLTIEDNSCTSDPFIGTIDVYEMPVADFVGGDSLEGCEALPVEFTDLSYNGNSSLYYTWNFGNGGSSTQSDPTSVYEAGLFDVHLSILTAEGCAGQITKNNYITVHEKPNALFGMSSNQLDILDPKVVVTNLAGGVVNSEFTFHPFEDVISGMQVTYHYPDTGHYSITQIVTTANGCLDTISDELVVKPHYTLYIPSAFTPDENALNEVWVPQGESVLYFEMTIYNRWDEELYVTSSLDDGWDGSYKGKQVPEGVYVYSIDVVDLLGETHKYRGTFRLLR